MESQHHRVDRYHQGHRVEGPHQVKLPIPTNLPDGLLPIPTVDEAHRTRPNLGPGLTVLVPTQTTLRTIRPL